ncbi:MAG: alanine--tRNA ligase, partial [Zetaproteobacteria bacterium]
MNVAEIRQRFLDYFAREGHEIVPSSPLVPHGDPTLLFTNAGMVQFKNVFLGKEKRPYQRAASCQKCVRAGGKHNDLENVGYTARHHTFFEMLGNFSFGDYFKREAIFYAWRFLTEELGLDPARLFVTVYVDDDEAARIWLDEIGIDPKRFARIAGEDNFWSMGDTGPCGPCTEIFFDHGPEVPGGPPGTPEADGDRFVEIWNIVFMQYDRDAEGRLHPLPHPNVDTGMGLERIAAVMQGVHSNFDIDLFRHLIDAASEITGVRYGEDAEKDISLRVIADHVRAIGFLIADGVLPSNEGRGFVLRRILRRALRHGWMLGRKEPFLWRMVAPLVDEMGGHYRELVEAQHNIEQVVRVEEERFLRTLGKGLKLVAEAAEKAADGGTIPGDTLFVLYDTYGFPVDLVADILRGRNLKLDLEGFERRMEEQRARARAAWKGSGEEAPEEAFLAIRDERGASEFLGYQTLAAEGAIVGIVRDGRMRDALAKGEQGWVVLNQTPFYGES